MIIAHAGILEAEPSARAHVPWIRGPQLIGEYRLPFYGLHLHLPDDVLQGDRRKDLLDRRCQISQHNIGVLESGAEQRKRGRR